jgi:Family of unknown function (DUF5889)
MKKKIFTKEEYNILKTYPERIKKLKKGMKDMKEVCKADMTRLLGILMIKYINKKGMVRCLTLKDLIKKEYMNKKIIPIECTERMRTVTKEYKENHEKMRNRSREYWDMHKRYNKTRDKFKKITSYMIKKIKDKETYEELNKYQKKIEESSEEYSKGTKEPSSGERMVMKILESLSKQREFYYFYLSRWYFCRDSNPLEYDFYCVLIHEGIFYQWVIEFDGDQHYEDCYLNDFEINHQHDILKQYYLAEMNIHLLRIRELSIESMLKKITKFINRVIKSKEYIAMCGIEPIEKYFKQTEINRGLEIFNEIILNNVSGEYKKDEEKQVKKINIKMIKEKDENNKLNEDELYDDLNGDIHIFVNKIQKRIYDLPEELNSEESEGSEIDEFEIEMERKRVRKSRKYKSERCVYYMFMLVDKYNGMIKNNTYDSDKSEESSESEKIYVTRCVNVCDKEDIIEYKNGKATMIVKL